MADITPVQVHDLLASTHEYLTSTKQASQAKDHLGHLLLDVARQAKVGLSDLSAVSGLHHATIRAMIQKAIGPTLPDGFLQPELPIWADLAPGTVTTTAARPKLGGSSQPVPLTPMKAKPSPAMTL